VVTGGRHKRQQDEKTRPDATVDKIPLESIELVAIKQNLAALNVAMKAVVPAVSVVVMDAANMGTATPTKMDKKDDARTRLQPKATDTRFRWNRLCCRTRGGA
jgi:hypothetical protein